MVDRAVRRQCRNQDMEQEKMPKYWTFDFVEPVFETKILSKMVLR